MTISQEVERASDPSVGEELLNVPMGMMIQQMAGAIADAQLELDTQAMTVAAMMSGAVFHEYTPEEKKAKAEALKTAAASAWKDTRDRSTEGWFEDTRIQFGYKFGLDKDSVPTQEPAWVSMMELGFTPNFYQFVDTIIEVKITVSITKTREGRSQSAEASRSTSASSASRRYASSSYRSSRGWGWWGSRGASASSSSSVSASSRTNVSASSVNASYSNKYSFDATGASLLRTKLKPIPAPAIFEDRVRQVMRLNAAWAAYTMKMDAVDLMELRKKETDAQFEARKATDPDAVKQEKDETLKELEARKEQAAADATREFAEDVQE